MRPAVIVVEDNPFFRDMYSEALDSDHDLSFAPSQQEAFKLLREQQFQVALLDMKLDESDRSNRDGLNVAEAIRDLGHNTTEIVIISGYPLDSPEVRKRVEKVKAFHILEKIDSNLLDELVNVVRRAAEAAGRPG